MRLEAIMETHIRFKLLAFLVGVFFFSAAQAKWFYTEGVLTNDAPSDAQCKFSVSLVTLKDGTGESVTGWQITSKNAKSAKKIDFTTAKGDTGYSVISVSASEFAQTCCEFIGPDVFDLSTNMFTATVADKKGNYPALYVTNIVISPNITRFPAKWALRTPLKTLKPNTFPYLRSFDDRCFSSCTNFQADATLLINSAVTNIGAAAFYKVPLKGSITLTNLENLGTEAFSFSNVSNGREVWLESVNVSGPLTTIPASCFVNSYNLKKADFSGCPNLNCILGNAFIGCTNLVSDISLIVNSSVTNIGSQAFRDAPVSGNLILPKIQNIGSAAFGLYNADTKSKAGLEAVIFGASFTNAYEGIFDNQTKLGSIIFGSKKVETSSSGHIFLNCSFLTNIWFKGYCPSADILNKILEGVPAGPKCIIYASTNLVEDTASGALWTSIASLATEAELAALNEKDRARCFGVYVNSQKQRKAYLVHRSSPYDPTHAGVIITVR